MWDFSEVIHFTLCASQCTATAALATLGRWALLQKGVQLQIFPSYVSQRRELFPLQSLNFLLWGVSMLSPALLFAVFFFPLPNQCLHFLSSGGKWIFFNISPAFLPQMCLFSLGSFLLPVLSQALVRLCRSLSRSTWKPSGRSFTTETKWAPHREKTGYPGCLRSWWL